jgi:hypothetical protein
MLRGRSRDAIVKEAKDHDPTISEELVAALQRRCPKGKMAALKPKTDD